MVRVELLRGKMAEKSVTQEKLAKALGVSLKTLSIKMNTRPETFSQLEIEGIIKFLEIENPVPIFFAQE
jgi:transcriptional regulator with XRE-family HTH domain